MLGNGHKTSEAKARELGYTTFIHAMSGAYDLQLLVKPSADLDSTFKAFCLDEHEFLSVNGWLFSCAEITQDYPELTIAEQEAIVE